MSSARDRGQLTRAQVDGGWPHQVAILTFDGPKWGDLLSRMLNWLRERAIDWRRGSFEERRVHFCFSAVETASAFQIAFGGELIAVEPKGSKLNTWIR